MEKLSFYKNNSHLIAKKLVNMAKTDAMEEIHTLPLGSMLNLDMSLKMAIQSITKPKNLGNV